jgi:outer membrane biosynthesis protein TonB
VLWSSMQEPQQPEQDHPHQEPTPEPNPETQPAPNPTPSQPGQQHASPVTPESQNKSATAQTFTGTISKEADNYVLKVSDSTSYKLDSQEQVQPFEGKRVQVTGTLDSSINLIHVDKVEPIS